MSDPLSDAWGYPTPSQAEGEREPDVQEHPDVARTTPSQAEGERAAEEGETELGREAREKDIS
ncbi:hypothetical protein [Streptomyces thermolilacinus]|uniref:Uncharacterized protein n=1 Tax=Streptomyces thermolilacinus SPC6 TaxID=1306406 RepID=A0A1D3DNN0_9ACTN|nr:hypothetical protein [Streptomyces thermolilacinus]OEJ93923.1 hypothetical protein J116_004990 [Streptomyces thermolilacinus SPC6]